MKNEELLRAIELIKNKEFHQAELILDKFMGAESSSVNKSYAYYLSYLVNLGLGKRNAAEIYFEKFLASCFDSSTLIERNGNSFMMSVKHEKRDKDKGESLVAITNSLIYLLSSFIPEQANICNITNAD